MNINSLSINRPVLATVFWILLFGVIGTSDVLACDCKPTPTVMDAVRSSQLVIHAKVIHAELKKPLDRDPELQDSLNKVDQRVSFGSRYVNEYTVVVVEGFRGATAGDTLIIRTGLGVSDCGFVLSPGSEHVFYAKSVFVDHRFLASYDQEASAYSTSSCTRTRPFSRREARAIRKVVPLIDNVQYRDSY